MASNPLYNYSKLYSCGCWQDKFAIIVDIHDTANVKESLVLPSILKNQLSENCSRFTLIDGVGRDSEVSVSDDEHGSIRIGGLDWPRFVDNNIDSYLGIVKLCFRKLQNDVFQVFCFNSTGKERIRKYSGDLVMKSCLIEVGDDTVDQQNIPCRLLNPLNKKSKKKPIKKAKLFGPIENAEVDVDYRFEEGNPKYDKWRAIGFSGSQWSQFVMANRIQVGYTMLFSYLEKQEFLVEVFSAEGIAVCKAGSSLENEFFDVAVEDEFESQPDFVHHSEVKKEKDSECEEHAEYRYWMMKFPKHPVKSKRLTVPADFVRQHKLFVYKKAQIVYKKKKFDGKLDIRKDSRKPGNLTHIHFMLDWKKFLEDTESEVGDRMLFELKVAKSASSGIAIFRLCG